MRRRRGVRGISLRKIRTKFSASEPENLSRLGRQTGGGKFRPRFVRRAHVFDRDHRAYVNTSSRTNDGRVGRQFTEYDYFDYHGRGCGGVVETSRKKCSRYSFVEIRIFQNAYLAVNEYRSRFNQTGSGGGPNRVYRTAVVVCMYGCVDNPAS